MYPVHGAGQGTRDEVRWPMHLTMGQYVVIGAWHAWEVIDVFQGGTVGNARSPSPSGEDRQGTTSLQ